MNKNPLSFQLDLNPDDFLPASEEEKQSQVIMRESVSFWKDGFRRLRKNKVAMVSIVVIILVMIFSFIVPSFYPYSYDQQIKGANNLAPFTYSADEQAKIDAGESVFPHVFGTDKMGRDYAIRVMMGSRISLLVGLIATAIILVIGSIYGSIAAFFGGWVDLIMMRIVDIIYTVPDVLLIVLLSFALKDPLNNLANAPGFKWVQTVGTNLISIFIVFALLYCTYGAKPDPYVKRKRICYSSKSAWCQQPQDHQKAFAYKLYWYFDCYNNTADSIFYFYREFPEFPRYGCCSSTSFFGKSGE